MLHRAWLLARGAVLQRERTRCSLQLYIGYLLELAELDVMDDECLEELDRLELVLMWHPP